MKYFDKKMQIDRQINIWMQKNLTEPIQCDFTNKSEPTDCFFMARTYYIHWIMKNILRFVLVKYSPTVAVLSQDAFSYLVNKNTNLLIKLQLIKATLNKLKIFYYIKIWLIIILKCFRFLWLVGLICCLIILFVFLVFFFT